MGEPGVAYSAWREVHEGAARHQARLPYRSVRNSKVQQCMQKCWARAGVKEAPLPAEMEALAEQLRRDEGLLLASEQPPEEVTAKAAFAARVRDFLLQQARMAAAVQSCHCNAALPLAPVAHLLAHGWPETGGAPKC